MTGQLRDQILADHATEAMAEDTTVVVNEEETVEVSNEAIEGELTVKNYKIVGYEKLDIPKSRDLELRKTFVPMLQTLDTFKENRAAIAQEFEKFRGSENLAPPELMAKAKRHRLDVAKIRVASEKARKFSNEEINMMKKANDKFAGMVKEFVTEDEKAMLEIEEHNEEIRIKQVEIEKLQLEKLQSERFAKLVGYGYTDASVDLSGMDESMFEAFVFGIKTKFEEAAKAESDRLDAERAEKLYKERHLKRKTEMVKYSDLFFSFDEVDFGALTDGAYDSEVERCKRLRAEFDELRKLSDERKTKCIPYSSYIIDFDTLDFGDMSQVDFDFLLHDVAERKADYDTEQDKIKADNERLELQAKELAEKELDIKKIRNERQAELQPYIVLIRDYNGMLDMSDEDYSKALAEIKEGLKQQQEFEAKQRLEKEEENRKAAEEDERKERLKALDDKKKHDEAVELEAKQREEKRIADVKALAEASSEITAEQIDRAKAEGKTVFVQVVSVEFIEGQSGIFIQSSDN